MRWTDPPTRREVTLVLFGVTVFILAFNLDNSLRLLGLDPVITEGTVLRKLGYPSLHDEIGQDGRKPSMASDPLEKQIFGDWEWKKGQVSGDGSEQQQGKGVDKYEAMWKNPKNVVVSNGGKTASDPLERWWTPPTTEVRKHVQGYSVVDNVVLFNGTTYFVTDDASMPGIQAFTAKHDHADGKWAVITSGEAAKLMPLYGGRITGVSWISTDTEPHESTLLSMWRAYSALDENIDAQGRTTLSPPRRLIFPYVPAFSDPKPVQPDDYRRRIRSQTGFSPAQQKLSFPTLGLMFKEDWSDFHLMQVPFVFERVVIADRSVAQTESQSAQPPFTELFSTSTSANWWEPIRQTLFMSLDTAVQKPKRSVVTYISRQREESGLKLKDEDNRALVEALAKLGKSQGFELYIVSPSDPWWYKAAAISKSTVTLGVHGSELLDAIYMKPKSTLIEFFPAGTFARNNELPARSVGLKYVGWWNERILEELPAVLQPTDQVVHIDAQAVAKAVKQALS